VCGDGVAVGSEACDDGSNNGAGYGSCAADCGLGPRCGDGVLDVDFEQCDNGLNSDRYATREDACAPGCVLPAVCGDAVVQPTFGEQCDLGTTSNSGDYGGCNADCTVGPHCGDGVVQEIEQCDDGNSTDGDGCNQFCNLDSNVEGQPVPAGPEPSTDVFVPDAPAANAPEPAAPALDPCR
jgi:cysteine-rich repeat protein